MKRLLLLVVCLLLVAACDVNFNGYTQDNPREDWNRYDYVFTGPSPDPEGIDMLMKINLGDDGFVDGETTGVFYARFEGTLADDLLELEMTFTDPKCDDLGHAYFTGLWQSGTLSGTMTVYACQWYEFDFDGELVGGSLYK